MKVATIAKDPAYVPAILFVDDERSVLRTLERFSRSKPWVTHVAESAQEALMMLQNVHIDIVVSDMRMPNMCGDQFLIKVRELYPQTIRILLTGYSDIHAMEVAINEAKIYNYITKPWDDNLLGEVLEGALRYQSSERERIRLEALTKKQNRQLGQLALSLERQVKERTIEIEQALTLLQSSHSKISKNYQDTLGVLTYLMEWSGGRANSKSHFVSEYAVKMGQNLQLPEEDVETLRIVGMLHDIGILSLPEPLRGKPVYSLTAEQRKVYEQHPKMGELALSSATGLAQVAKIIRASHEHIDGSGFPDGLCAEAIPRAAKIIAILSDYHDLCQGLIEKNCTDHEDARHYLKRHAGTYYDRELLKVFFDVMVDFHEQQLGSLLRKSHQLKTGMVLQQDIVSASGLLLLIRGTVLTATIIDKLQDYERQFNMKLEVAVTIPA